MRMMMMMNDDDDNDYGDGDDNDDDDNDDNDDQVAGRGGQVRWEMRDQLPYTVATLREVQRSVVVIWSLYNDNDDDNNNDHNDPDQVRGYRPHWADAQDGVRCLPGRVRAGPGHAGARQPLRLPQGGVRRRGYVYRYLDAEDTRV